MAVKDILAKFRHIVLLWLGPLVIAGIGGWLYLQGGRYVETNNAYLKVDKVSISTEVPGKLTEVLVGDNSRVEEGQVLFRVDARPYRIAVDEARARLDQVRREIESLRAEYRSRQADLAETRTDLAYYRREYERVSELLATSAVSAAQVDEAEYRFEHARRQEEAARQALAEVRARLADPGQPVERHPDYRLAQAQLERAKLDLSRVATRAPSDGIAAKVDLHVGEYLAAGAPLFTLVDGSHVWVEANFKETDLTYMETGQAATVEVDTYPGYRWQAAVSSMTPGTGSEFSLLPAQNSSGNWVKVVQRIPVKLELAPQDGDPSLTAGMSAQVKVDTGHERHLPWL